MLKPLSHRLLLSTYLAYGLAFIASSSAIIDGARYFLLFDDAMISMRYARNLAEGFGLVWNPGAAPVEGYSNLLWTLWMALLHLLPLPERLLSLPVQLGGLALCLGCGALLLSRPLQRLFAPQALLLAATLSLFYMPLNYWSLMGMEVGLLAFLLLAAHLLFLSDSGRAQALAFFLCGLALLTRLDALVYVGTLWLAHGWMRQKGRALFVLWSALTLLIAMGGQELWRWHTYHELLPNTYYLKMSGLPLLLRLQRGATVTGDFLLRQAALLPFFALGWLWHGRERAVAPLAWVFVAACGYSFWCGGDAWEQLLGANRFICVAIPGYFALVGLGAWGALTRLGQSKPALRLALGLAILLPLANLSGGREPLRRWMLLSKPAYSGAHAGLADLGLNLRRSTREQARLAIVSAGHLGYFSQRYCADLFGKSDTQIARLPMRPELLAKPIRDWLPGHTKFDLRISLDQHRPDLLVQVPDDEGERAVLRERGYRAFNFGGWTVYERGQKLKD